MNNMREILFKAKRKDDGEWVEGYYFYNANIKKHYIKTWICYYEVDQETICQYIGLTDKNGKKIWENDIVYARCKGLSAKGIIAYEKGCLVIKENKRQRTYSLFGDWKLRTDGNIFDNAELLEG